jgi:hypothetical protein
MRAARLPPELCTGPFTTVRALAAGLTNRQLQSAPWRHLTRNVYVLDSIPDSYALRLQVVGLLLPPGAAISGAAAAFLLGVDVTAAGQPIEVTAPRGITLSQRGQLVAARQAELPDPDVVDVGGIRVTSPLRTAFDLARRLPLVEAVVGLDALLHAGLVDASELLEYAAAHHGWPGIHRVPRVVDLSEPLSDSPMESRMRLVLVLRGGLPRPTAQFVVKVAGSTYRLDLAYEERRIDVEYDGDQHERSRISDARRRNRLGRAHWRVLTYTSQNVYQRPDAIVREVSEALGRAA